MAQANKLTDTRVKALKEVGTYSDGLGLYLAITRQGTKNWMLRYQIEGRRREMGLGRYPEVKLTDARDKRDAARELISLGVDPIEARNQVRADRKRVEAPAPGVPTFRECAKAVITLKQPEWKNAKHGAQWAATLENYVYPVIGELPVDQVTLEHMLEILQPIWLARTETAGRVRSRVEAVLGWARVKGYRTGDNPAAWKDNLEFLLQKPGLVKKVRRQPSLPYSLVPGLMARLLEIRTSPAAALATIILTALRQSEVRLARGQEIDARGLVWTVPADRVKRPLTDGVEKFPHYVPLSPVELALLKRYKARGSAFVFPGAREGIVLSETAIRKLIKTLIQPEKDKPAVLPHFTMHGFRSTFKNWVMEKSQVADRDMLSEAQLAHKLGSDVKVAYLRTTLLDLRRELMQAWLRYCLSETPRALLVGLGVAAADLDRLDLGLAPSVPLQSVS